MISQQEVDEVFRYYRTSATALSASMIGISAALIVLLRDLTDLAYWPRALSLISLLAIILLSCVMQYLHFLGYSFKAEHLLSAQHHLRMVELADAIKKTGSALPADLPTEIVQRQKASGCAFLKAKRAFSFLQWVTHFTFALFLVTVAYLG